MRGMLGLALALLLAGCGTTNGSPSASPSVEPASRATESVGPTKSPRADAESSATPSISAEPGASDAGSAVPPDSVPPSGGSGGGSGTGSGSGSGGIAADPPRFFGTDAACPFPANVGLVFAGEASLGALELTDPQSPSAAELGVVYITAGPIPMGNPEPERAWCFVIDMDGAPFVEVGLVPAEWKLPVHMTP